MGKTFELTYFERELKKWYTDHGELMPWDLFLIKENDIRKKYDIYSDPYYAIDPCCRNFSNAVYDKNHGFIDFKNLQWLVSGQYCMMTKQPRYFPNISFEVSSACLFYAYSGTSVVILSEENIDRTIILKAGDFLFNPNHTRKTILCNDDDANLFYFTFSPDLFHHADLEGIPSVILSGNNSNTEMIPQEILHYSTLDDPKILFYIEEMLQESSEQKQNHHRILFHYLILLILYLQREYKNIYDTPNSIKHSYIPDFQKYLRDHYTDFSLQSMSEEFHLSSSHICRLYKQHTGITLMKSLQSIRIQIAKYLLENTMDSVENVAFHTGYSDTSYFIEVFKKETGLTPFNYRRQFQSL